MTDAQRTITEPSGPYKAPSKARIQEGHVYSLLRAHGPKTARELARLSSGNTPLVSRILQRLKRKGHVDSVGAPGAYGHLWWAIKKDEVKL